MKVLNLSVWHYYWGAMPTYHNLQKVSRDDSVSPIEALWVFFEIFRGSPKFQIQYAHYLQLGLNGFILKKTKENENENIKMKKNPGSRLEVAC